MKQILAVIALCLQNILWNGGYDCLLAQGNPEDGQVRQQLARSESVDLTAGKDWVEEKTGSFVPLSARFKDELGRDIALADIIDRPTLLLPIYFYCPSSCSQNLANLANSIRQLKALPGKDFRVIAFSFNEQETVEDAARAKKNYLKLAGDSFPEKEWFYLTGRREAISALSAALGYRFQKMADETYIHPSALVAVAGDGKIIRYVYGSFIPGDIDMAIADAAKGTPSMSVKRLLGICFGSDPDANKSVFTAVKIVILAFFIGGAAVFVVYTRKRGRRSDSGPRL